MPRLRHSLAALLIACCLGSAMAQSDLQLSPAHSLDLATTSSVTAASPTLTLSSPLSNEIQDDLPTIPFIDLTRSPDDLWQRVRNGFSMTDLTGPLVTDRQAWYLNRPDVLRRTLERSKPYLFHIVGELEKRGMPTELALLPFVESSYNPLAYSPARAHGMWQFIPSTGKNYNLQQNWWMDQRRDIIASTTAALDYLQNIYEMHGDWHLALASYNWGEGAVGRAVARNQAKGLPTDYMSLTMPLETRYYVPKLQALKNIIADPKLFGLSLDPIPNLPYFGTVQRDGPMDIVIAARLAEIPVAEFVALNPAYSRPRMPDADNSSLVVPAGKVQTFIDNLQRYEAQDKPLSTWRTYTMTKGDKLDSIAARNQISGALLRQINGITKRSRVGPGTTLLIPEKGALASNAALAAQLPQTPATPPKVRAVKKKGAGTTVSRKSNARASAKAPAKAKIKTKSKPQAKKPQKPRSGSH